METNNTVSVHEHSAHRSDSRSLLPKLEVHPVHYQTESKSLLGHSR